MAAKLEAVMSSRVRNRSMERAVMFGGDCSVKRSEFGIRGIEDAEELSVVLEKIFSNLNSSLGGTDPAKFESLIHARSWAKELTLTFW